MMRIKNLLARQCISHIKHDGRSLLFAHRRLDVVGDPLHEVGAVLVLHVQHLLINLLGGHAATEQRARRQVSPVPRVSCAHPATAGERHMSHGACLTLIFCEAKAHQNNFIVMAPDGHTSVCEAIVLRIQITYARQAGRQAHMFLASHICCVSSGTLSARYCWLPREVSGVKPTMKKCSLGNGIKLTASFRRSARLSNQCHRIRMPCIKNACVCDALCKWQSVQLYDRHQPAPEFSWPGNRRQQVMPDMTAEMRWFRSPKVGLVSFSVRKQISYNASLSSTCL